MGKGTGVGKGPGNGTWQRVFLTSVQLNAQSAQFPIDVEVLADCVCRRTKRERLEACRGSRRWRKELFGKLSLWHIALLCHMSDSGRRHVSQASDSRICSTAGVRRCCGSWLGWAAQAAFNCQPNCHVLQRQHPSGGEGLEPHAFSGKGTLSRNTTRPSFSATADWPLAHRAGLREQSMRERLSRREILPPIEKKNIKGKFRRSEWRVVTGPQGRFQNMPPLEFTPTRSKKNVRAFVPGGGMEGEGKNKKIV